MREKHLSLVSTGTNISTSPRPVNVNVLSFLVLGIRKLGLDLKCMRTEVITLGLQQVRWQVLGTVTVEPAQSRRESRGRYAEKSSLGDDVTPAWLGGVDGLVEEVGEEEVLQVVVFAVGGGDVLQEDGADNAATTPHESDRGLVKLPLEFLGSLSYHVRNNFYEGWKCAYLLHEHETLSIRDNL